MNMPPNLTVVFVPGDRSSAEAREFQGPPPGTKHVEERVRVVAGSCAQRVVGVDDTVDQYRSDSGLADITMGAVDERDAIPGGNAVHADEGGCVHHMAELSARIHKCGATNPMGSPVAGRSAKKHTERCNPESARLCKRLARGT